MMKMLNSASLLCAAIGLAACVPIPVPISVSQSSASVASASWSDVSVSGPSDVNYYRKEAGLSPLIRSSQADAAAERHAADMNANRFMRHRGSDGSRFSARLRRAGCGGAMAENLAQGSIYSRGNVIQAWMESPGHRANILNGSVNQYGLARVGDSWVMTLASYC